MSQRKNWLAFGTGVGVEISSGKLIVVVSAVRPSGVDVLGTHVVENYLTRPAADWGGEYAAFLKKIGAAHLAATVVLPRRELSIRVLAFPGVSPADLEAAIRLQVDALHPYPEDDAAWAWTRIGKSNSVLVAITRQTWMDRHIELFAEAGVTISSLTFSAALLYGSLRLYSTPPVEGFVGALETAAGAEFYGESPARGMFTASIGQEMERGAALAISELRLPPLTTCGDLAAMIPVPRRVFHGGTLPAEAYTSYLASLAAACPRLSLRVNLLPLAQRGSSSRWIYAPALALSVLLVIALATLGLYSRYRDSQYLAALNGEIQSLEPKARQLAALDRKLEQSRARMHLLDRFQNRTKQDLDALREATRVIAPPAWLNTLELGRATLVVSGEADQATGLLKALDSSPQFQNSEFMVPLSRVGTVEIFRIKSAREGVER
ncbi:MAG: hypothetical protein HYZ37_16315 [Candidatus Solibacter usitatus]|nr:hypothetical protein [Candidatus Solibacter usitatus]